MSWSRAGLVVIAGTAFAFGMGTGGIAVADEVEQPGDLYHFAGNPDQSASDNGRIPVRSKDVPTSWEAAIPLADLELHDHRSVTAKDGSVYIADWTDNVVLHVSEGLVIRVAGNGGPPAIAELPAPATSVPLDGPWGIDVDANGKVYFAEFQPSVGPDWCPVPDPNVPCGPASPEHEAGRILKLEPTTGILSSVGDVPAPVKVKMGRGQILYVAAKNGFGSGGIWKLPLTGPNQGLAQLLVPDVDAEGIAVYEPGSGESYLYVAAAIPDLDNDSWSDAYVCRVDLDSPAGCSVIQRFPFFSDNAQPGDLPGPLPDLFVFSDVDASSLARVTDIEVDSNGVLQLMSTFEDPAHWGGGFDISFNRTVMWGGTNPIIHTWDPDTPTAIWHFGYVPEVFQPSYCFFNNRRGTLAPPPDPVPGTWVRTCWGSSLSVGIGGSVFFSERDSGLSCLSGTCNPNYRSYEIQNVGASGRPFYPVRNRSCGLGFELVFLMPLSMLARRRRS